jgi:hypothetical protein
MNTIKDINTTNKDYNRYNMILICYIRGIIMDIEYII